MFTLTFHIFIYRSRRRQGKEVMKDDEGRMEEEGVYEDRETSNNDETSCNNENMEEDEEELQPLQRDIRCIPTAPGKERS